MARMFHRIEHDGNSSIVWTDGDPDRTGIALRYVVHAYSGEPLFCVRGRDHLAVASASAYHTIAHDAIARGYMEDAGVLEAVSLDIDIISAWQRANPGLLKYPDR